MKTGDVASVVKLFESLFVCLLSCSVKSNLVLKQFLMA